MSNYTITTDFGAKDDLPSGNASKVIKGSEFTTEFTNIKTAVNSKADSDAPTFTGATTFSGTVTLNDDVTFDTNTMFVDVSTNRVGIGNVAPATALDVTGVITTDGLTSSTGIDITGTVTASGLTVDTDTLYVDATNNRVGIGTTSPDSLLEVVGADPILTVRDTETGLASTNATLRLAESGGGDALGNYWDINYTSNSALRILSNTTEHMRIDSSGNIGIGTDSPTYPLDIAGASGTTLSVRNTSTVSSILLSNGSSANQIFSRGANSSTGRDLAFVQGTSEAMRIDSSGNVGIGTTSPATNLHVSSSGDTIARITSADGNGAFLDLGDASDPDGGRIVYDSGSNLGFSTSSTERMRINSSGNVGIGTSSPSHKLHVLGSGSTISTKIEATDGNQSSLDLKNNEGEFRLINNGGTLQIYDQTDSAERMRIDSAGTLLVGKTSASSATVGFQAGQDGFIAATRASAQPLVLNRTTNDGIIAEFKKDGSTVGSIGTSQGNTYYAGTATGITFGSANLYPTNSSGTKTDAALDLGSSSQRFKDLYLSGGVHLGGTGTANKLDDYEEGTWTPTLIGSTSGSASLTVTQATYTKIGNTVRVACFISEANVTGLSGAVRLAGLPFSVATYTPVTVTYCNLFSFDEADGIGGFTEAGQTYVNLVFGSSKSLIQHTSADATSGTVMFTAVYNTST